MPVSTYPISPFLTLCHSEHDDHKVVALSRGKNWSTPSQHFPDDNTVTEYVTTVSVVFAYRDREHCNLFSLTAITLFKKMCNHQSILTFIANFESL